MLYVVYLQEKDDKHSVLVAAFLMKSDAESFMKKSNLGDDHFIKETSDKAWSHWRKIGEEI
ncbi:MAG: hypothetical protein ACSHXL_00085 [Bacteroidota bacterium]